MTSSALLIPQLLKMEEPDFNTAIGDMSITNLIETITLIQKEMTREQENFTALGSELSGLKKTSGQYKSISKEMTASQARLTLLMDRSMKCFNQKMRNSENQTADKNKSEPVKPKSEPLPVNRLSTSDKPPSLKNSAGSRTMIKVQSLKTNNPVKVNKAEINGANNDDINRLSFDAKKDIVSHALPSMQDTTSCQPVLENVSQIAVSNSQQIKDISSQNSGATNGYASEPDLKATLVMSVTEDVKDNLADNKLTKDSAQAANLNGLQHEQPEVVKSSEKPSKPASKVVLNVDKQLIDLDSFTERKNMLSELKKFDKHLKSVPVKSDAVSEIKVAMNASKPDEDIKQEPHGFEVDVRSKSALFGEIKAVKKPSDNSVSSKTSKTNGPSSNSKTNSENDKNDQAKQFDSLLDDMDADSADLNKNPEKETQDDVNTDIEQNIVIIKDTDTGILEAHNPLMVQKIPASDEITAPQWRTIDTVKEESDDCVSQTSDMSTDDDRFVTEFSFPSVLSNIQAAPKAASLTGLKMATDFSSAFANRFETALSEQVQPATEMVNARLQRIEELERLRQERLAAHPPPNASTASARLERRERLIRQSTTRSSERRSFAPNVQRTPVHRSQSYETTGSVTNEETLTFREAFESTRQNLFGLRATASTDNLTSLFNRRTPEVATYSSRSNLTQETESTSNTRARPDSDLASIAEAFSSVRAGLGLGIESSLASRETNRAAISTTRESRSPSTNFQRFVMSNQSPGSDSPLTRSASVREARRESRFRRRTIQGVDTNVMEALERDRTTVERDRTSVETRSALRSSSVTRGQITRSSSQTTLSAAAQIVQNKGNATLSAQTTATSSTTSSYASSSYSAYSYNGRGKAVEILPEETAPVLGLEEEKVKFVDNKGHCHWLNKNHQLVRSMKNSNMVPEIVVKDKLPEENDKENQSYIAQLDNDANKRYEKLRELVVLAHLKDSKVDQNCDETDSAIADFRNVTLIELCQRNDLVARLNKTNNGVIDIDEKFKSFSLYTTPRPKPDLEEFLSTRVVVPLYEGIDMSVFDRTDGNSESLPQQISQNRFGPRSPLVYELSSSRFASSHRSTSYVTASNGTMTSTQENRFDNQQEHFSYSRSDNGLESETISYVNSENSSFSQSSLTTNNLLLDDHQRSRARVRFSEPEPEPAEDDSEVNLVMERLQLMQGATGQVLDTSHLDYEEMLMIQKALEENPSPPESPQPLPETQDSPEVSYFPSLTETSTIPRLTPTISRLQTDASVISRLQVTEEVPRPEQTTIIPKRILPMTPQLETLPSRRQYGSFTRQMRQTSQGSAPVEGQLVERALTQAGDNNIVASYSNSNNTSQLSVTMSEIEHIEESQTSSSLLESEAQVFSSISERRSIANVNETKTSSVPTNVSLNTQTQSASSSSVISEQRARLRGFTPRLQRISSSGSGGETSPRLQRLSSSGSDSLLPLPSMDFSQRQGSPGRDSTVFNFSQASGTSAFTLNTASNMDKNKPDTSSSPSSKSGINVNSQLSIEIPDSSGASPTHSVRRGSCGTPKSATSPLVRSQSGSEAPSPAGSDSVTMVFEEFVQTIPSALLSNWSPAPV